MTFYTGASLTINSGATFANAGTTALTAALTGTTGTFSGLFSALNFSATYGIAAATGVFSGAVDINSMTGDLIINPPDSNFSALEVSSEIAANNTFLVITSTGVITLTGTPTINISATNGQIMYIKNIGSDAITFQDNDTHAGSLLELGDTGRALGTSDGLGLLFYDGSWYETAYNDN